MDHPRPLTTEALYALAPADLRSYRQIRYDGGGMAASLADFAPADQKLLRQVYAAIGQIFDLLQTHRDNLAAALPRLEALYASDWPGLVAEMRNLGDNIPTAAAAVRLRQVVHDLRGGAFQALALHLQLLGVSQFRPDIHRIFFLARDQRKIMRNALPDLDPHGTARDADLRLHNIDLLVEKWQAGEHLAGGRSATVAVDCRYRGAIAERCLEFSALDRVLYNLLNNATAHAVDSRIELAILPLPERNPQHLRLVVANRIAPEQRRTIAERFPAGPGELFAGGFTTGGSGLGLRICADFVANAYGLASVAQGLGEGHFGAAIRDDRFLAWVHWPIAAD